jgi:signal transduction histidine kinase
MSTAQQQTQNKKATSIAKLFNRVVLLVVVVGLAFFALLIGFYNYERSITELQNKASHTVDLAALSLQEPIWNYDHAALDGIAQAILLDGDFQGIKIIRYDKDATVIEKVTAELSFDDLMKDSSNIITTGMVKRGDELIAKVYLATSTDKVFALIRYTSTMIGGLALALVVFISIVVWYLGRKMIQEPIQFLRQSADQLASGNLSYIINTSRADELGSLAHSFDVMRNSIRHMMKEQARAEQAAAQAQIQQVQNDALKAQAEQAQAQLIQSEKMASLGQLVASVTHEINTPIGAIKSSGSSITEALHDVINQLPPLLKRLDDATSCLLVELLQQANIPKAPMSSREERAIVKKATEELEVAGIEQARQKAVLLVNFNVQSELEKYLPLLRHPESGHILEASRNLFIAVGSAKNVNLAVDRVTKIVKALKSFSHFNIGSEKVLSSLTEGVEIVLTIYQGQTKVGVEVVRNYDEVPDLLCFPDELNQVWTNLIHNALQAMNHEGTLTVGVRKEGECAVVSVGDSGCGIPEEIRNKIFDVFFTTKPAGVGSGLGLDIVKKIIEKHNGRIDLQSEVGVGTTFSVYLPYA